MEWRARITDRFGRVLGSGTLIDKRRVLTAAHVVFEEPDICVSFPGTVEDVSATVEVQGAWCELGDSEDFSVLKLSQPAPVEPCKLADPRGWGSKSSRKLAVLGFPTGHEQHGRLVELRAEESNWIANEWLQLNVSEGHVPALARGFSGAGVYDPGSGEVVGILTDADLDRDYLGAIGRMLPLARLRRYWEPLDDLLPLTWLTPESRHDLRMLLCEAEVAVPLEDVLQNSFPTLNDNPKFESPWDLVRYVAEQNITDDALPRVLSMLKPTVDSVTRGGLAHWLSANVPNATPAPSEEKCPSIMVRIERRTKGPFEITLSLVRNNVVTQVEGPIKVLRRQQIRRAVEECLPRLTGPAARTGADWMIQFVVPEKLLSDPFDDFEIQELGAESSRRRPIRSVPVVVCHLDRLRHDLMATSLARRRWQRLQQAESIEPKQIPCLTNQTYQQVLSEFEADEDISALACAACPPESVLSAALDSGIPIMLWQRRTCEGGSHVECDRYIGKLADHLVGTRPQRLPDEVKRLRNMAQSATESMCHCGRNLTLFWDDPNRAQDPPLAMER